MSERSWKQVNLFGVQYSAVDYTSATKIILEHAQARKSLGVSALAVHGLMTSVTHSPLRKIINRIQLIVPDGQPVRWAMNSFYHLGLKDRVYGPTLTLRVLEAANKNKLKIFLFGSTRQTLQRFRQGIEEKFPSVQIVGIHVDRFREATEEENQADVEMIKQSGAHIVLVGRGCPRQEFWVARNVGKIPAAMLAVGAAFDFHAGTLPQAPRWMQNLGLEWFFRLLMEPKRLFKRYLVTNTQFMYFFFKHKFILGRPY